MINKASLLFKDRKLDAARFLIEPPYYIRINFMGRSKPIDNILSAINLEEPERVAVTALEQEHAVALAGIKYSEFARDSKKLAKTHLLAIRRYRLDWTWIHVDDWIPYEPMGVKFGSSMTRFLHPRISQLNRRRI